MMDDIGDIPAEEIRYAEEEKAVRCDFMKRDGDATCGITEAGMEWVEALVLLRRIRSIESGAFR